MRQPIMRSILERSLCRPRRMRLWQLQMQWGLVQVGLFVQHWHQFVCFHQRCKYFFNILDFLGKVNKYLINLTWFKLVCNGNGKCVCGKCVCTPNSGYFGLQCEDCPVSNEFSKIKLFLLQNFSIIRLVHCLVRKIETAFSVKRFRQANESLSRTVINAIRCWCWKVCRR